MAAKPKRRKEAGFIGLMLAKGGDMSLYERLNQEVKTTTMSRSLIVRLALLEYFEKRDGKKLQ